MPSTPLLCSSVPSTRGLFVNGSLTASSSTNAKGPSNHPTSLSAVDLHLHSSYANGVSPAMTLENIVPWARRKGIDVLGTGDCLQPEHLQDIQTKLLETGSGLLTLRPEFDEANKQTHPTRPHRALRFVLSTEVCCAPQGTRRLGGLHHLIFFQSLESVRRFRSRVALFGDLREGRPTLALSSRELLALVLQHGDGCELAPAHILSPWFSTLGSESGGRSLHDIFGDLTPHLLAVEMGLTSTPPMCRRIAALDGHALFCCSDAHSLEHIGREYTLLSIEPSYASLMSALRQSGPGQVRAFIKFPVERAGYYYNFCSACQRAFDGTTCPRCGRPLATGSRDRLEAIADQPEAVAADDAPPFQQLLPLADLIADFMGVGVRTKRVNYVYAQLLGAFGHERYILTEATADELTAATTSDFARAIVAQRHSPPRLARIDQFSWDF